MVKKKRKRKKKKLVRTGGDDAILHQAVRSRKCGKRLLRTQALRMLSEKRAEDEIEGEVGGGGAVTPGYSNGEGSKEFLSTGRTGRRNAMPDILGQHAETGTADLPTRLERLTTESQHDQPGTSGMIQPASPSQQQTG
ncbi:uncharacterized protein LOC107038888 [Diachasma alloeum]|uniref:uncharacterized protein LOC107038888 n=1 Tax=Diachasma alloeum TaxID=454923 RepID=UPI00073822FF|nr:uncharacterized protein LOC107038888 [Diachasma alloeum]